MKEKNNITSAKGVRKLGIKDIAPDCEIFVNKNIYDLSEISRNKKVIDIGCGYGQLKKVVENSGGQWVGVEKFEGGVHTVIGDAENLPFSNNSFDVAIMHAVLEHVPDASKAFAEVARVLKPDGVFVGYVAFMECFHEISYSHLSFKALENFAEKNGMKLEKISGGSAFGIDYHLSVLFYPVPMKMLRKFIAFCIRKVFLIKSFFAFIGLNVFRKYDKRKAKELSQLYYKVECLRQSNGFNFVIRKISK